MFKSVSFNRQLYKTFGYPVQAIAAWITFAFFSILPVDWASNFSGWIGRTVGPRLKINQRAENNLRLALPELDDSQIATIIIEMWDNLGRIVGEMPHLAKIAESKPGGRIEVVGEEIILANRLDETPCIFFSGHFANWEILAMAAKSVGVPYAQVYRAANNPFVDAMLRRIRGLDKNNSIPKGPRGARSAVALLRSGRRLGMLVDQKMNDGIAVPFFGQAAMTAPALADLSLRYDCPAIPVRLERLGGCRFRVRLFSPLNAPNSGNRTRDTAEMMVTTNRLLEDWIRERPGQWLWLHNRWPD